MESRRRIVSAHWLVYILLETVSATYDAFPDVTESNPDPTGQTTGGQLVVDGQHTYADLDELIVNHVQAMARRVDELTNHGKFKSGEDELRESLVLTNAFFKK